MAPVERCRTRTSTSIAKINATDIAKPMTAVHCREPGRAHNDARLHSLQGDGLATHTARRPSAAFCSSLGGGTSLGYHTPMAQQAQTALLARDEGGGGGRTWVLGVRDGLSGTDTSMNIIVITIKTTKQQLSFRIIKERHRRPRGGLSRRVERGR